MKKYILVILSVLTVMFFSGCVDEPTDIGFNQLKQEDIINIAEFNSDSIKQSTSIIKIVSNLGSYKRFLVGKYFDTEAQSLVRFNLYLTDTLKNLVKNNGVNILSAQVSFYPAYTLGDSTIKNFLFDIFEITTGWNSDSFTADSLVASHFQFKPNLINENFNLTDTLLTCNLNKNIVLEWLKAIADTTLPSHKGIYLKTPANSNVQMIKGFKALPSIDYSPVTYLQVIFQYGSQIDTLNYSAISDVHVLLTKYNQTNKKIFYVQPGVEFRTNLGFEISAFSTKVIINNAMLQLFPNSDESKYGNFTLDTLVAFRMIDSTKQTIDSVKYAYIIRNQKGIYEGNIYSLIQDGVNKKEFQGIYLAARDVLGGAEFLAFNNQYADDPLKRPKLKIIYSTKK